jgi:hypothetical protein
MQTRKALALIGLALLAGASGCRSARPIGFLEDPETVTLVSIDGNVRANSGNLTPEQEKGEKWQGYPVLGKAEITDPEQRRQVISAVQKAIHNGPDRPFVCFVPRHVLHISKQGETLNVAICFECLRYRVYPADSDQPKAVGTISRDAQPLLDGILTDAGVPLAPKTGED